MGLLGIDLATRRRNRMNGRVIHQDADGISIHFDQSFGNCPQYIQKRSLEFVREPNSAQAHRQSERFTALSNEARTLISNADTFFVSSYVTAGERPAIEGVDVSHRGGRPGFVAVAENTLTIPDFPGNYHFNTLGNFLLNPKAGLVFADFSTGDLLQLSGSVELLEKDDPALFGFRGAERGWRFTLNRGNWLRDALPFRFSSPESSPDSELTDDWQAARTRAEVAAERNSWRPHRVVRVEDESSNIRSFYLKPTDGAGIPEYLAGQHLPMKVRLPDGIKDPVRTYTLSSAPADSSYRVSVKREEQGSVSRFLHDHIEPGDVIEAKGPRGGFHIDPAEKRPALLFAGGVGITPMISMARHVVHEGIRTRHLRPLTVFHASRSIEQRAFAKAFRELEQITDGAAPVVALPAEADVAVIRFVRSGFEQKWERGDGTLLEVAKQHGLTPAMAAEAAPVAPAQPDLSAAIP